MIEREHIASAARNNDALVEEIGFEALFAKYDVDLTGVLDVQFQRALRCGLILEGRPVHAMTKRPTQVSLKRSTERLLAHFGGAWLDGFATGLRVRREQ